MIQIARVRIFFRVEFRRDRIIVSFRAANVRFAGQSILGEAKLERWFLLGSFRSG